MHARTRGAEILVTTGPWFSQAAERGPVTRSSEIRYPNRVFVGDFWRFTKKHAVQS